MVKVNGYGSFKEGPSIKRFGAAAVKVGCNLVIFDMENCLGMDSTFMGVMAGMALRMQSDAGGKVVAMNLSPKTASLLQTLGLDRIITCYQQEHLPDEFKTVLADIMDLKELDLEEDDKVSSLTTMLTAHQDLVEAAPENISKFKDVISFLDQDLKALEGR
jgi:anti-anti-sigma regulatory factor